MKKSGCIPVFRQLFEGGRTCPSDLCYFEPGCWGDLPDTEEAPQEDNQTQDMIDYSWDFYSRKVAWSLKTALHLALLRIPLNYQDLDEIKGVEQAVNCTSMRGKKRFKIRTIRKRL